MNRTDYLNILNGLRKMIDDAPDESHRQGAIMAAEAFLQTVAVPPLEEVLVKLVVADYACDGCGRTIDGSGSDPFFAPKALALTRRYHPHCHPYPGEHENGGALNDEQRGR